MGLGYNAKQDTLYATDWKSPKSALYVVDTKTGFLTPMANIGFPLSHGGSCARRISPRADSAGSASHGHHVPCQETAASSPRLRPHARLLSSRSGTPATKTLRTLADTTPAIVSFSWRSPERQSPGDVFGGGFCVFLLRPVTCSS